MKQSRSKISASEYKKYQRFDCEERYEEIGDHHSYSGFMKTKNCACSKTTK